MKNIKDITRISIVAALYIVLTWINPYSYGEIQFRISEVLVLLCFFRKDYCYSLIIGCLIGNFFSVAGILDVVFGTLATAISVVLIAKSKRLFIATIYPVIFNGIIVGALLYFTLGKPIPIYLMMTYVAIGEFGVVSVIGYLLFTVLRKNRLFLDVIEANQNIADIS
ncbi:MAG: QueT transporter family protein [Bacilli bacterium]|nr:QueT transporter family protein [Bacilli bacterium]